MEGSWSRTATSASGAAGHCGCSTGATTSATPSTPPASSAKAASAPTSAGSCRSAPVTDPMRVGPSPSAEVTSWTTRASPGASIAPEVSRSKRPGPGPSPRAVTKAATTRTDQVMRYHQR